MEMFESSNQLTYLLNDTNSSLPLLLNFLQADDQHRLFSACRGLLHHRKTIQLFLNSIYFCRYFRFDHSLNLLWGYSDHQSFFDRDAAVRTISNLQELDFGQLPNKTTCATKTLIAQLSKLIAPQEAVQLVGDLSETLRQGPMTLPTLRRQHVGMNANSPLQFFLCDLLAQEECDINEQPLYSTLRQNVFDSHEKFTETARSLKTNLKRMRVLAEQPVRYQETQCVLLNLISLVLELCDAHIQSVSVFLHSIASLSERLVYFISYYINFRKTAIALHDKLGFLFEEFQYVFDEYHPEWRVLPPFSIVSILLKKWLRNMGDMHLLFNSVFSLLLMKEREHRLASFVEESSNPMTQMLFNEEFKTKAASLESFSSLLERKLPLRKDECLEALNSSPDALKYIIHHYLEYLVDLSVNEISVHMNDHSNQKLGHVYTEAAKVVLEQSKMFYNHLTCSLGNVPQVRLLIESDVKAMRELLKQATIKQLVTVANSHINSMRPAHEINKKDGFETVWGDVVIAFEKEDYKIESMLENMGFVLELPQQTQHLFDISNRADLQKLQKLLDTAQSVCDLDDLEAYCSEAQEDDSVVGEENSQAVEMEVQDEGLKISSSISTREQQDSMQDSLPGKRPRDFEIEYEEEVPQLKRIKPLLAHPQI